MFNRYWFVFITLNYKPEYAVPSLAFTPYTEEQLQHRYFGLCFHSFSATFTLNMYQLWALAAVAANFRNGICISGAM